MVLANILGVGMTKAGELWNRSLVDLIVEAGRAALLDSGRRPTAVVVGNALAGALGDQRNLAAFAADRLGVIGAEVHTVDSDEASGGAAVRLALALIGSGFHETVLVIGCEKTSDALPDSLEAVRASALDVAREAGFGFGQNVAAGLAMQRYIDKHKVEREAFFHFPKIAHENGAKNGLAFFAWPLSMEQYSKSPIVAEPATVCDSAPQCDGAAALVLATPNAHSGAAVEIIASSVASAQPGIVGTAQELELKAAALSAKAALLQAQMKIDEISVFELHDSSSILAALSLEAIGLCEPGGAPALAASGALGLEGEHPVWTFGGHKARGNAPGAAGVYQLVEASLQLLGKAGDNQVAAARTAFVQCLGSFGSTAITHILRGGGASR